MEQVDLAAAVAFEPAWYPCPSCGAEHMHESRVCWDCRHKAERLEQRARRVHESLATIPEEFAWAAFDAPELATRVAGGVATCVKAQRMTTAKRALLQGPAGRGKTSLACAMLRSWVGHTGARGLFVPALRLSGGRFALDGDFLGAALIVLDDVGTERQQANNMVPDLVYERHAAGLATWVTTGLELGQMVERYGDGIARRMVDRAVTLRLGA